MGGGGGGKIPGIHLWALKTLISGFGLSPKNTNKRNKQKTNKQEEQA